MMEVVSSLGNLVGFIGFTAACVMLAMTPTREGTFINNTTRWFLFCACAIYSYVCAADLLEDTSLFGFADYFEGYIEMLFPVFALMAVYAALASQQVGDLNRSQRALSQSHDLLLGVVDAAPSGILFLDKTSAIAFANNVAKDVLDLDEDELTGRFSSPWFDDDMVPSALSVLLTEQPASGVPLRIEWPNGWRVDLSVNTEPLSDAQGRFAGVVATFERPRPD